MIGYRPVSVSRGAFRFCRYSVAALMWLGVLLRQEWAVAFCAAVMALSALLTVGRAPLVTLYTRTVNRVFPSPAEVLDENGMRFAHTVALFAMGAPLAAMHLGQPSLVEPAWRMLTYVAFFKTIGALGYCPVSRMYTRFVGKGACCGPVAGQGKARG